MTATSQNFTMYSGDTKNLTFTVTDNDGSDVDVTGCTISWGLSTAASGAAVTVSKTTGGGDISISSNEFSLTIDPADTASLSGTYYHEAEVTDVSSDVSTVAVGKVTINADMVT